MPILTPAAYAEIQRPIGINLTNNEITKIIAITITKKVNTSYIIQTSLYKFY